MNRDRSLCPGEQRQEVRFGVDPGSSCAKAFEGELINDGTVVTNPELRRDLLTGFNGELGSIERRARTHATDRSVATSPESVATGQIDCPLSRR